MNRSPGILELKYQTESSWILSSSVVVSCVDSFPPKNSQVFAIMERIVFRWMDCKECAKYSPITSLISVHVEMEFHTTICKQITENPLKTRTLSDGKALQSNAFAFGTSVSENFVAQRRATDIGNIYVKSVHSIGKFIFLQFFTHSHKHTSTLLHAITSSQKWKATDRCAAGTQRTLSSKERMFAHRRYNYVWWRVALSSHNSHANSVSLIFMRTCLIWRLALYFIYPFFIGLLFSPLEMARRHICSMHLCIWRTLYFSYIYMMNMPSMVAAINLVAHVLAGARMRAQQSQQHSRK